MHRPPRLDGEAARLLRKVGAGRRIELGDSALSLAYRRSGGTGLVLSGALGRESVRLWVDAQQWCRWIEPVLAVADASSIPAELHDALAAWTFDTIGRGLDGSPHMAPTHWPAGTAFRRTEVEPRLGWCLLAEHERRRLDMLVLDAPHEWLDTLADRLSPCVHADLPEVWIRASLLAGWSSVAQSMATSLRVGDALLLRHAYHVAGREFGLFANRPLARVSCGETGTFTIEEVMEEFNDWLDVEPRMPASDDGEAATYDPLVTIVAQVCGFDVPASALAALKPGDILTGQARSDEFVTLKAGGRTIARATLIDIDGRLAAKIEAM